MHAAGSRDSFFLHWMIFLDVEMVLRSNNMNFTSLNFCDRVCYQNIKWNETAIGGSTPHLFENHACRLCFFLPIFYAVVHLRKRYKEMKCEMKSDIIEHSTFLYITYFLSGCFESILLLWYSNKILSYKKWKI